MTGSAEREPEGVSGRGRDADPGVYRARSLPELLQAPAGLMAAGGLLVSLAAEWASFPHAALVFSVALAAAFAGFLIMKRRRNRRPSPAPRRRAQAESGAIADPLARLPDKTRFVFRLQEEHQRAARSGGSVAVAIFDVSGLAEVNRQYTEHAGDEVLRHVAGVLGSVKRASDMLVRFSDDEFAVLLLDCDERGARAYIERVEHALTKEPAQAEVRGRRITLWTGVCSGAAASGPNVRDASQLLTHASEDLHRARYERERRRQAWLQKL